MDKAHEYAKLILLQINSMFQEDSENHIDTEEFEDGENMTAFIHALATVAPSFIYNKLVGDDKNHLEFNHLANHLVMQNIQIRKEGEAE